MNSRQITGLIIGILGFIIFSNISFEGLPDKAGSMAGIAVLMASWWIFEAIPLPVTALLPLALYPLFNILPSSRTAFNYANHLIFLFIGGFMLAAAIQKWNFHKRIALTIIKFVGTNPYQILLGFMIATAFLAMWISNTATTMMVLPIAMAVVIQMSMNVKLENEDSEKSEEIFKSTFGMTLMLGIAYGASIGGIGTLIGTPPNIVFAGFIKEIFPGAPEIGFMQWMLVGLPVVIIFLPITWFLLAFVTTKIPLRKFTFKKDDDFDVITEELKSLGSLSKAEKLLSVVFALTVFLWMFRNPINLGFLKIPGWSELFSLEHAKYFHDATVAIAMAISLFLIPVNRKKGEFLLDWRTARHTVPWGIVLLFGGGFALAAGFAETGLDKWIGSHLESLGGMPVIVMILLVCFMMTFLTEVTSNTATATMILPILAVTAQALGKHPFILMMPAAISASCAFMLPVATPPNAIVFGSGWVNITKMARIGLVLNLIGVVIISMLIYFLVPAIFGIDISTLPEWAQPK